MSTIQLCRKHVGVIHLDDGLVDITDPGYSRDVWCRMNDVKVKSGAWNCYAYYGSMDEFGERVMICQIVAAEDDDADLAEDKICSGKSWRTIGEIGVDGGQAGFFSHKPDFSGEKWDELCEWMFHSDKPESERKYPHDTYLRDFDGREGFWTESGFGDGAYTVHAIRNDKREIIALEIRF